MATGAGTYEKQGKLGISLGVLALLAALAVGGLLARNYKPEIRQIVYGQGSNYILLIIGGLGVALLAAGAGFMLGFNSAGQKRNTQPRLSWTAFFLNAAVIALTLSLALVFYLMKFELIKQSTTAN